MRSNHKWIKWIRELQAMSQNGLVHTRNPFDIERYERLGCIAREMFAAIGGVPVSKIEEFFVPDRGYCTPKIDLRAGLFANGKMLLVHERSDGKWSMPGGWADVNDTPSQGIIREIVEESGYIVDHVELVAVIDRSAHPYKPRYPHHVYKLFFYGLPRGRTEILHGHETADARFFGLDELPELSEARVLRQDVERLFAYHEKKTRVYVD